MNVRSQQRSQQSRPADTRTAILDAALELFCERGFHGTAVPLIAQRAGIAAGTIYRHFASKEALVNALYRDSKTALMTALAEDFPVGANPREQFRSFWFRIVRYAREQPRELAFLELHHHGDYLDAESLALEEASFGPFHAFFDLPDTRALVKPLPAKLLVITVWGVLAQLFKAYRLGHVPWDEELIAAAERCAWDAVARHED